MSHRERTRDGDRAQSESIGVILLTAVVVITVSLTGMVYLSTIDANAEQPMFSVEGELSPPNVSVTHAGGDPVPGDELRLVLRVDATRVHTAAYGETFAPGETWSLNVSNHATVRSGSVIGVSLYHAPSGSQLYSEEWSADEEWP